MIVSRKDSATPFENSSVCNGISYGDTGNDMDGALIRVNGRYPYVGYLVNEVCKELVYVTQGSGTLIGPDSIQAFESGDVVYVDKMEHFAWDGNFEGFFMTSPKFDPAQHKEVAS